MKLEIFAVYDSAVQAYMQPMFFRSKGEAIRALQSAVSDGSTQFCKTPADYTLFCFGSFDDNSGVFDTAPPERVIGCLELATRE